MVATDRFGAAGFYDAVTSSDRAEEYVRLGYWNGDTLSERVALHASQRPRDVACVDRRGSRRFTFAELSRDAAEVALGLTRYGVVSGSVVSIQLPNCYEAVCLALAAQSLGAVINPLLPTYGSRELAHVYATAKPVVHFTPVVRSSTAFADVVSAARRRSSWSPMHVALPLDDDDPIAGCFEWAVDGSNVAEPSQHVGTIPTEAGRAISEVIFTSGTEAVPKAVMHTENTANFSMRTAYTGLGMQDDDVVWMPSPIGHSTGFNYGVRFALYHGLKLVLQDTWSAEEAYDLVNQEGCTYTLAATTFLHDLVHYTETRRLDLPKMRLFGCGGAPVPEGLVHRAAQTGITVLRLYGATEFLVATWNRPGSTPSQRSRTDGCPLDGVEVTIRDADGGACPRLTAGEVWVRGPNTCVGFFSDPVRTSEAIDPEGWVRSGDLGMIDQDGYLSLIGRKKDIIIRGGLNIAPREIEEALADFPEVWQAAVVGVPDERLGERMFACVVFQPGTSVELDTMNQRLLEQGFAKYKLPESLRVFDEFPMTASGKVQKHELKRRIADAL